MDIKTLQYNVCIRCCNLTTQHVIVQVKIFLRTATPGPVCVCVCAYACVCVSSTSLLPCRHCAAVHVGAWRRQPSCLGAKLVHLQALEQAQAQAQAQAHKHSPVLTHNAASQRAAPPRLVMLITVQRTVQCALKSGRITTTAGARVTEAESFVDGSRADRHGQK